MTHWYPPAARPAHRRRSLAALPTAVVAASVILATATAALTPLAGAQAAAAPFANGATDTPSFVNLHLSWSGSFTETWPTTTSTNDPRGVPGDVASAHIDWSATAEIPKQSFEKGLSGVVSDPSPIPHWHYSVLSGSYTYKSESTSCSADLSERGGYESTSSDEALVTWYASSDSYEILATTPFTFQALTTGLSSDSPCEPFAYWVEPQGDAKWNAAFGRDVTLTPAQLSGPGYSDASTKVTWPAPTENATDIVQTDFTASGESTCAINTVEMAGPGLFRGLAPTAALTAATVCPQIMWENPPGGQPKDVTGKTESVLAGQIVTLEVRVNGRAPPSASWTGFGSDAIDSARPYDFTNGETVVPLGDPIERIGVTVAWSDPEAQARSIDVTADGASASTTFAVRGPTVTVTATRHCTLGIDTTVSTDFAKPPGVYLGENEKCGAHPGITWDITVSGAPGRVGLNQLVASQLVYDGRTCEMKGDSLADGNTFYLDDSLFVFPQDGADTGYNSAGAHWIAEDAPGAYLKWMKIGGVLFTSKSFRTSLMYRPPGGVWVALAQSTWSYSATVRRTGKTGWKLLTRNKHAKFNQPTKTVPFVRPVPLSAFPSWSSSLPTSFAKKGSC